jgi:hypothetical protein
MKKKIFLFIVIIFVISILFFLCKLKLKQKFNGNTLKIAVISAIFGGYEKLKEHENVLHKEEFDWYCFTDNTDLQSTTWKIINTPYHIINTPPDTLKNNYNNITNQNTKNMMSAKYYKAQTHKIDILEKYDYFIWIDGSIILRDNFVKDILELINNNKDSDIILYKHSDNRKNVEEEVMFCKDWGKYKDQDLQSQIDTYKQNKFQDNHLFALTSFYRKNNQSINKIFDEWWLHNLKYSYQDQVSLPYVIWESGIKNYTLLDVNVYDNYLYYNAGHLVNPF